MQCPVCKIDLRITDRQGIEVDYCPQCRGVWLDRGELDKILERESKLSYGRERDDRGFERRDHDDRGFERRDRDDDYDDRDRHGGYGKRRKRGGLLGELFDFD